MTYIYPNPLVPSPWERWNPVKSNEGLERGYYRFDYTPEENPEAEILRREVEKLKSELRVHVECANGEHEYEYINDDLVCKHCGKRHPDFKGGE